MSPDSNSRFNCLQDPVDHFVNNGRGCDARCIVLLRENKTGEANQCADRVLCLPTDDSVPPL